MHILINPINKKYKIQNKREESRSPWKPASLTTIDQFSQ